MLFYFPEKKNLLPFSVWKRQKERAPFFSENKKTRSFRLGRIDRVATQIHSAKRCLFIGYVSALRKLYPLSVTRKTRHPLPLPCKLEDALCSPFTQKRSLFHTKQKLSEHRLFKLLFCLNGFLVFYTIPPQSSVCQMFAPYFFQKFIKTRTRAFSFGNLIRFPFAVAPADVSEKRPPAFTYRFA